jgi:hypothetical protein
MLRHVVRTCPRRYNNIAALRRPSLIGWQAAAAGQRLRGHVPRDLTGRRLLSARPLDGRDGGGADGAVGAFSVRGPCRSVFLRFRVAELLLCPDASLSGRRAVCGVAGPARQCVARRASRRARPRVAWPVPAVRCGHGARRSRHGRESCVLDGPAVAGKWPQHGVGVGRGRDDREVGRPCASPTSPSPRAERGHRRGCRRVQVVFDEARGLVAGRAETNVLGGSGVQRRLRQRCRSPTVGGNWRDQPRVRPRG